MKPRCPSSIILVASLMALAAAVPAPALERSDVPEKLTWAMNDLYADEAAWVAAKDAVVTMIPGLGRNKGRLGESAQVLHETLAMQVDIDQRLVRLATYATMLYDTDTRVGRAQQMMQQASQLRVDAQAAAAWIRPEILALGAEKVRAFIASEPRLADWKQPLEDTLRGAEHTLDPVSERIVAQAGTIADSGQSVRTAFVNADMPYPSVKLSTGETVRLDAAGYTRYRAVANRDDRRLVFREFWKTYGAFTRTLGTTLNAQVEAHVFNKTVRGFDSSLAAALFPDNVPTTVYMQLIADVRANLPTLHRYLKLRKKMMGLDRLGYEDLYAPIIGGSARTFTPEEAQTLTLRAVAPLGSEYQEILRGGFESRWVDWMPTTGKRSGAYSTGVYGVHPFQLQNFTGLYDELSTLAHEAGHSMHTFLADRAQPYPTHDYPIFIAEVASTINENLLFHAMLDAARSDDERLVLLGSYLDNLRGTLFRQTLFAEFELRIHEKVERGEPLTGEALSALYLTLVREYYGHDQGVCEVADAYGAEWAYIPHFYYDFYVYQYATSIVASVSLAEGILAERSASPPATAKRDAYLRMLAAGSSRYAYDLLKDAGVDLATSAPIQAAIREMNRIIDEIETILAKT